MSYVSRIRRRLKDVAAPVFWGIVNPFRRRAAKLRDGVARACKTGDRWVSESVARAFGLAEGRLGPITLIVLTVFGVLAIVFRDWLQTGPDGLESGSTTLRNLSLVVAALIALPLAIWRSKVAERQADAGHRQVGTAQQSLLNERYQQGAEMLGSDVLTVRLGGIYALQRLAEEHPEQYHIQIMRLFCAFARHPTRDESHAAEEDSSTPEPASEGKLADPRIQLRQDVQAVMTAISVCHDRRGDIEYDGQVLLNLKGASLAGAELWSTDFSHAHFVESNLSAANLWNSNLSGAILWEANLARATLQKTNLTRARLKNADLSGARLSLDGEHQAIGLTQGQLNRARADPNTPPQLDGVVDAETGEQLIWRGKPLDGET